MTSPTAQQTTLAFEREIHAPFDQIWSMFANRDDICDWLCADARMRFDADGGFGLFIWRDGRHAYGTYTDIIPNEKIHMTWHDGQMPVTETIWTFRRHDDYTHLTLQHSGLPDDSRADHYRKFWETHLHELKTQMETGARPSITDRVVLGVMVDNSEEARRLPGLTIDRAIDGYSAATAGIQGGDRLVTVKNQSIDSIADMGALLANNKPGDTVPVTYLRDESEHSATITLKGYPVPPIPATLAEMVQQHRDEYATVNAALQQALDDISAAAAAFRPDADSRSIREILAHMILTQRHTLEWLSTYANGPRLINPYASEPERIAAVVAAHPTASELFAELQRTQAETIAMIEQFDSSIESRKHYLWWMAYEIHWTEEVALRLVQQIDERKQQAASA